MVEYAKNRGIQHLEIINNASLMNENIVRSIIENGIDRVQLSIDSLNKENYDVLRASKKKGHSYYKTALKNILSFLKINEEYNHKVYVSISAVQTTLNKHEQEEFQKFWNKLPIDNVYFSKLSSLQDNSPMEEAERFSGNIKEKQICVIPWITLSIKADGDIVICSHDYHNRYPIGNIEQDKLINVWNNEKAYKLRQSLIDAELDYFVDIQHDCVKCNNPCNGAGKDDFVKNIPLYMEKTVLGKFSKKEIEFDKNFLEKELEKYENI
jgi:radical SAM protein with 4Fe4S-binding SPASM domain